MKLNLIIPNSATIIDVVGQVRRISENEEDKNFQLGVNFMNVAPDFYDKLLAWDEKAYKLWFDAINNGDGSVEENAVDELSSKENETEMPTTS